MDTSAVALAGLWAHALSLDLRPGKFALGLFTHPDRRMRPPLVPAL